MTQAPNIPDVTLVETLDQGTVAVDQVNHGESFSSGRVVAARKTRRLEDGEWIAFDPDTGREIAGDYEDDRHITMRGEHLPQIEYVDVCVEKENVVNVEVVEDQINVYVFSPESPRDSISEFEFPLDGGDK